MLKKTYVGKKIIVVVLFKLMSGQWMFIILHMLVISESIVYKILQKFVYCINNILINKLA